ncbi:MAG: hypothetical protein COU69_01075 [Candidatus Pacebacteria bacterium CG10_big_fil_rev_8_21_14_0_10_56_10]|nr:MAG: hypothetical protein COU69_01075 [Candidatus Pacebacteria bacterium CG10_big_fil_rev_8_21_14_0_10_56_10]
MNTTGNAHSNSPQQSAGNNPLARAMAESAQRAGNQDASPTSSGNDYPLSEAMAKTGGQFPDGFPELLNNPIALQRRQAELQRHQKKEAARQRLHKELNPLDATDVFNAREQQVKREIDQLRQELRLLVSDVGQLNKDIDIAVAQEVVNPGQTGAYHLNFFQKLKQLIMLLRQRVKSAATWLSYTRAIVSKKRSKRGPTLGMTGKAGKKTHDLMHHEMSQATSAG